jgi:cytochrome bd-type quinol oxidase subunit 1
MYEPSIGWTYFILLHMIFIPLAIYLGTFIRIGNTKKYMKKV